ncbi:MAG: hypothetical protein GC154_15755 [bacterium]|nr:hypothetical protein [bacterium]
MTRFKCLLFVLPLVAFLPPQGCSQTISYQMGVDGYANYHDVVISSQYSNASYGNLGNISNNNRHLLIRFGSLTAEPGIYSATLELYPQTVISAGTFNLYRISRTNWNDPAATLNPPSSNSMYPTWNYENYNLLAWNTPGVVGGTDVIGQWGSQYHSDSSALVFNATTVVSGGDESIALVLTCSGEYTLYHASNYPSTAYLPRLTLTLLEAIGMSRGGLDWSAMWNPFRALR